MSIPWSNVNFMWHTVIDPRRGTPYSWGGSFDPNDTRVGTDCSGAVSAVIEAMVHGPQMNWNRQFWTGTFQGLDPGDVGPYGLICIAHPDDHPGDAAAIVAIRQGPSADSSHMMIQVNGTNIEDGDGLVTGPGAADIHESQFNQWFYLPGPIDPAPGQPQNPTPPAQPAIGPTFFADVSEFQHVVDDSYPYPVLSIRASDGTHEDQHFAANYAWMRNALDTGKLTLGIVYTYCRPAWQDNVNTVISMINDNGGLHPKVALMLDVESGYGNPPGDAGSYVGPIHDQLAAFATNERIIGYANLKDLNGYWISKPKDIKLIVAAYGSNPSYPNKIAHQYTDGSGFGARSNLPDGCPPFGNCDFNVADHTTPEQFAALCGINVGAPPTPDPVPTPTPDPVPVPVPAGIWIPLDGIDQLTNLIWAQFSG